MLAAKLKWQVLEVLKSPNPSPAEGPVVAMADSQTSIIIDRVQPKPDIAFIGLIDSFWSKQDLSFLAVFI